MLTRIPELRSTFGHFLFVMALTLFFSAHSITAVEAQTTWIGGSNTNWFDATNWDTGEVPNDNQTFQSTTDVVINGEGNGPATVRLTQDGRTAVRSLSLGTGDNLRVENGFFDTPRLAIQGPNTTSDQNILLNQGVISLITSDSFLTSTITLELNNNITLSGGGTIELTDAEILFSDNFISEPTVINTDNQIQGSGEINLSNVNSFTNGTAGLISANQDGGQLAIQNSNFGVDFANEGTLRAENGGELTLDVPILNSGTIEALDGSRVLLSREASVTGGVVRSSGSGTVSVVSPLTRFELDEVLLDDVTLDTDIDVLQGAGLRLQGTIDNRQTISTQEVGTSDFFGAPKTISIGGEVTLTGGGSIDLLDAGFGFLNTDSPTTAAGNVVNRDNTIRGSGDIAANFVNEAEGLVVANRIQNDLEFVTDTLVFAEQSTINRGTFRAEDGGTLTLNGGSEVINEGVIEALDNSLVAVQTDLSGGILRSVGSGRVTVRLDEISNLTLDGTITVIDEAGISGEINNLGRIELGEFDESLLVVRDGVTLSGGGTVALSSSQFNQSGITDLSDFFGGTPPTSPSVLRNIDNTIIGGGFLGSQTLQVINEEDGLIEAFGALSVISSGTDQPLINRGTLRAGEDSLLVLNERESFDDAPSVINNEGGIIEALSGAEVALTGSNTTGGVLRTLGDGTFSVREDGFGGGVTRISDATVGGNFQFADQNASLELEGISTNGELLSFSKAEDEFPFFDDFGGRINFIGNSSLAEGGTIRLAAETIAITDVLAGDAGDLINVNSTIEGVGEIDYQTQDFTNEADGLINANVEDRALVISTGSADNAVVNRGTLRASDGGFLSINGNGDGVLDNTDGRIEAISGSAVILENQAIVNGGEIVGDDDSLLLLGTSSGFNAPSVVGALQDVTLDVTAELANRASFGFEGQIVNQQSILATSRNALVLTADTNFSGGGTIQLGAEVGLDGSLRSTISDSRFEQSEALTLTNTDNTIQGYGTIGSPETSVVNEAAGVIQANALFQTLTIGSQGDSSLINRGILRASNGSVLEISDQSFDNDGTIETLEASQVLGLGDLRNGIDGILQGDGTIQFTNILNEGTIAPGMTLGMLTLEGNVELASSSILEIELFGTEDGQFDVLDVIGDLDLGGLLSVNLDGFTPTANDQFLVATANQFLGSFENVTLGELHRTNDGLFDFLVSVDDSALTPGLLLSNFQAVAIPEPSSAILIGIALATCFTRRRR